MHHPHPKTPLSATFEAEALSEGASRGFQALAIPVNYRVFVAHGYCYGAMDFRKDSSVLSFSSGSMPRKSSTEM